MTTNNNILMCICKATEMTVSMMHLLIEIMFIWKIIKSHFKGSYGKHNLTLLVMSYEIYQICQRLVSQISHKLTTLVRSSLP